MALINCPKCDKKVSDRAAQCPKCGYQINKVMSSTGCYKKTWGWIACIIGVLAIGIGVSTAVLSDSGKNVDADTVVEITPEFIASIRQFDEVSDFSEGLAVVMKDSVYGYIDTKGNIIVPCKYKEAYPFENYMACVYSDSASAYGFINRKGELVIPCKYEEKSSFTSDGLCRVKKNGLYNFVNNKGEVIETEEVNKFSPTNVRPNANESSIQDAMEFREPINSYNIEPSEFVGLKDSLNIVVPAKYTSIGLFRNGVAVATLSNVTDQSDHRGGITITGYVDKKGNTTFTEDDYKRFYADRKRLSDIAEEKVRLEAEKARLEAERHRIERERRENPGILFTELMSNKAWRSPDMTISGLGYRDNLEMIITFRPQTDNYGQATIVGWYPGRERWNRILTGDSYNYTINGKTLKIDAKNSNRMFPLIFVIENKGDAIRLQLTDPYLKFDMIPKSRNLVPSPFKM